MNILNDLLDSLNVDAPVRSVLVGAHWTVVCSRTCGLAATLLPDHSHGAASLRDVGRLHTKTARELAEYARSEDLLEASVGVAAINSLLDVDESRAVEINAVEVLIERGRGKNVALIGHFPFIPKLRPAVGRLFVIEQRPAEGEYPAEAAAELIPQADVVAITSSALINHTLDGLLDLCRPAALVMTLGPSTPLSPVLFRCRVDIISGTRVVDEAAVLRTVGQGATFRQVEGVKLLTFFHANPDPHPTQARSNHVELDQIRSPKYAASSHLHLEQTQKSGNIGSCIQNAPHFIYRMAELSATPNTAISLRLPPPASVQGANPFSSFTAYPAHAFSARRRKSRKRWGFA